MTVVGEVSMPTSKACSIRRSSKIHFYHVTATVSAQNLYLLQVQTFQAGHVGDAVSLAVSPDGLMVATGEVSKHPAVIVWLAASGEAVRVRF